MTCTKKGSNWGDAETRIFLELCTEKQILAIMDGKKHKHSEIFQLLVPDITKKGYPRTAEQMKLRLKNLKLAYYKCIRENRVSGASPSRCPYYDELELLYGCRPTAEATLNDNSGIDTCAVNNARVDDSITDNTVDASPEQVHSSLTSDDEEIIHQPIEKRRKVSARCGRKSYESTLENYTEKWMDRQATMLETMLDRQDQMQQKTIADEMEKQRQWEERELEKERNFQREQTTMMMQTFLQSITAMRPQMPTFPQNKYVPLRIISTNNRSSTASTTATSHGPNPGRKTVSTKENIPDT